MPTPAEITRSAEIVRVVRKDAVTKQRLYNRVAPLIGSFAFDAAVEEMSAAQFAAKCLSMLGLANSIPENPVEALDSYLAGRQKAADRARGSMDTLPETSAVARYLKGA